MGAFLPLFAMLSQEKHQRFVLFSLGMAIYCLTQCGDMPYVWWSLLALPILWCYNGQPGCRGWKWAFYVFYPAHLAVLYLIGEIM